MKRLDIIETIGKEFLTTNIENDEFSYVQALGRQIKGNFKLDLRFYDEESDVAVLVETKRLYKAKDVKQLFAYVDLEQELSSRTKIIAILANTDNDLFQIWKVEKDTQVKLDDSKLKTMKEYVRYFQKQNENDKTAVLENTSKLNRILHDHGIPEKLRSQFVGTCLLALKNDLVYKELDTDQIIAGIKRKLGKLLQESMDKAKKLTVLQTKVLENQNVEAIDGKDFEKILLFIEENILPYINESSFEGQDILSYFFTTFNKYVAREDKNQAFTPNHICHFMSKVAGIDRKTRVLDRTCGSGTFLVQAMTMELAQCETDAEKYDVKANQIFGIEFDESVFGLSTTNMLIHGDGNSNIRCGSCFANDRWIENAKIDVVLMNPPYNASKSQMPKDFGKKFGKSATDPSKGLYFVNHILKCVKNQKGRLLALLPMSCAITTNGIIKDIKKQILDNNTLDAVFSFPDEMFYPGASAVACCMVFNVGKPHPKDFETFFGYFKEDGFEKRKGVGRIDVRNKWNDIEKEWLDLYRHRSSIAGKSVTMHVSNEDEWCAEAYMETDYSNLNQQDFEKKMKEYIAFKFLSE
jgi:type I restriction-modification system DNA methylase subunit